MTISPLPLPSRTAAVPDWLRQPPAIALLASLGVHGLLFSLWPLLQTAPVAEPVERRPVGVVSLTPAEIARLPATRSALDAAPLAPGALPPAGSLLPPPTLLPPASLPPLALPGGLLDLPPAPVVPAPEPVSPTRGAAPTPAQPSTSAPTRADETSAPQSDRTAADPRLYTYDPSGTDASKAYDQLATVVAEAQKKAPGLEFTTVEKPLELPLPTEACFDQVKPMVLAVIVTPAGKAQEDPQVLVSSGYPILNQRAVEALKTRLYSLKPRTQLYVYTLLFKAAEGAAPACAARAATAPGGQ
jgi:hypothetical protein